MFHNGHFRVGEFLESMGTRAPESEDIETYKDLGRTEESIVAFLDRPPPGNTDADKWRRVAIETAFADVKPELARWFEGVELSNPEAIEIGRGGLSRDGVLFEGAYAIPR